MTKSELIEALARRQTHLAFADVELAVKSVIEQMSHALSNGERIEVRGFGSFALHYRPPLGGFVDYIEPAGHDLCRGRATFRGREYGRFEMERLR